MDYDVLIIGSGFGGSVSAMRLAEKGYDVGVLEVVRLSAAVERQLPRWRGTGVRGGELFVEARGEPRMHYVLVSDTARTQLVPRDPADPTPALAALETMTVAWRT